MASSLFSAVLLFGALLPAAAQEAEPVWRDPEWVAAKAKGAYYHVSVAGTLRDGPPGGEKREGKAFAVGPTLLVTSQHVVGTPGEWSSRTGLPVEVARAIRPLDRAVELRRDGNGPQPVSIDNPIVLPAPDFVLDAAGISVPTLKLDTYFRLSLCDIVKDRDYAAIMTSAARPAEPGSIESPIVTELSAAGYQPARYGPLYVFDMVENPDFSGEPDGHDGSPILDADGNVVALVSAVTTKPGGNGYRVLATPIQPLFPSAAALLARAPDFSEGADGGLKCSLSETVKRINDQVAAHAVWSMRVDREPDGRPSDEIFLRYESVAEEPNIDSIMVAFDFWGKQRKEAPVRRLTYPDTTANEIGIGRSEPFGNREFAISDIVIEGKRQVEAFLKDKNEGGYIDYVEVRVFRTHLLDKRTINRETSLDFEWKQP